MRQVTDTRTKDALLYYWLIVGGCLHKQAAIFFVTMQKKKKQNEKTTPEAPRKVGRPRSYTPKALEAKFEEYDKWAKANPRYTYRATSEGPIAVPLERPLTLAGFCIHAGIVPETFRNLEDREEYFCVCAQVRARIEADQLEGALCEQFNPTIASRVLKLADRQDITTDGKSIQQTTTPISVSLDADAAKIIQSIGKMTSEE